jgi:hypothetical protein
VANTISPSSVAENTAAPADPYLGRLEPEDREIYLATSGDLDLTQEIRLMRVVLSRLISDIPANKQAISTLFGALVRLVAFQAGKSSETDDIERALQDASVKVLEHREGYLDVLLERNEE